MSTTVLTAHPAPVTELLVELSRERAAAGDDRGAALAVWAADVHVLESLLWQHGLGETPDPAAQLAALGEVVAGTLEQAAASLRASATEAVEPDVEPDVEPGAAGADLTARGVVERAREAMLATFDASVHELLAERFAPLDHLDEVPAAADVTDAMPAVGRLDGRTPAELVAGLRSAAADCMAVAALLAAEHHEAAAVRQARQSDAAAFEAYLVESAVRAGDTTLAGVELRWALAGRVMEELAASTPATGLSLEASGLTGDPDHVVDDVLFEQRRRLTGLVGWAERDALTAVLEPLPEPVVPHPAGPGTHS